MGKITVKHFINKDLNPVHKGNQLAYPVYVQVIALQKNLKFKSNNNLFSYLSEDDINRSEILSLLEEERANIQHIVSDLLDKDLDNKITSKYINLYSENLDDMIQRKFSDMLRKEVDDKFVPTAILDASYSEIHDIIHFYGNYLPFTQISNKVSDSILAIETIYDDIRKSIYYVYDLFGGSKHNELSTLLRIADKSPKGDHLLKLLQDLALL